MTNKVENFTLNGESTNGVLGIWTRNCKIVGANESNQLWWPHKIGPFVLQEQT